MPGPVPYFQLTVPYTPGSGGEVLTADNGLTKNTANNVQLGGALINAITTLTAGSNTLLITGNSAAANPILSITSTSTAAASNLQKGLNVELSGANATALQYTYGIFSLNTHTGTTSRNVGIYGESSGGTLVNYGVQGVTSTGIGVYGSSASTGKGVVGISDSNTGTEGVSNTGVGGNFQSTSTYGLQAQSTDGIAALLMSVPSSTNTVAEILRMTRLSSGTAANGIGSSVEYHTEVSDGSFQIANQLISKWTTVTVGTRTSQFIITGVNNAVTGDIAYFNGNGMVGIGSAAANATRLNIVDNSISDGAIVRITSSSTAANNDSQRGLEILLTGANANASEFTYGAYISNAHSGTTSINYAILGIAGNGTTANIGVSGQATGSGAVGVTGNGTGWGGQFFSTGVALDAQNYGGGYATTFVTTAVSTNSEAVVGTIGRSSSGTAANGIAGSIVYMIQTTNGTIGESNRMIWTWTDATHATRSSTLKFTGTFAAATVDLVTFAGDGSVKLRSITATEASAITPAAGMYIMVNSTNGTFTSAGFWGYDGSAWNKF